MDLRILHSVPYVMYDAGGCHTKMNWDVEKSLFRWVLRVGEETGWDSEYAGNSGWADEGRWK